MKGLSPLVSVVLLIAFVVAIAGFISVWLSGLTTSTTEFTSEQSEKSLTCANARLKFESVTSTGIVYSNPSPVSITNVSLYDMNGRNLTLNGTTLSPGQVANLTWSRASNTSVLIKGLCESTIFIEGECRDGLICWR